MTSMTRKVKHRSVTDRNLMKCKILKLSIITKLSCAILLTAMVFVFSCNSSSPKKSEKNPTVNPTNTNVTPTPTVTQSVTPTPSPIVLQLDNYSKVNDALHRSGRPTEKDVQDIKTLGIKSILSLESYVAQEDEKEAEEKWILAAGMKLLTVPMNPVTKPTVEEVKQALNYVLDPSNQPILVHCYHGSDRTGIVIAAYRIKHDGWTIDQATKEMQDFGHSAFLSWWNDILKEI